MVEEVFEVDVVVIVVVDLIEEFELMKSLREGMQRDYFLMLEDSFGD